MTYSQTTETKMKTERRESQVDEIPGEPDMLTEKDYENAALEGTLRE